MSPAAASGESHHKAPGVLIPVRRTESGECGHNIAVGRSVHTFGPFLALGCALDYGHLVPEPLDCGSGYEDASLKGVFHMVLVSYRYCCDQSVFGRNRLGSRVHQHEASCTVGVLHVAFLEAALSEQGALLVSGGSGYGDLRPVGLEMGISVHVTGGFDLRQDVPGDI